MQGKERGAALYLGQLLLCKDSILKNLHESAILKVIISYSVVIWTQISAIQCASSGDPFIFARVDFLPLQK